MKHEDQKITVKVNVDAPVDFLWNLWTNPSHIKLWNNLADDWHTTEVINNFREGGNFSYRMEKKDGSFGFNYAGVYDKISTHKTIAHTLDDGRKVINEFISDGSRTVITETFEPDPSEAEEIQRTSCQTVLNNFKIYAERQLIEHT